MAADNAAGGGTMPDDVGMAPGDDTVPVPQSGAEKPAMGPPMPQPSGMPRRPMYELRKQGDFAGLWNQGATCYLNSLLQVLFMCPEFRAVLMQWEYDPEVHGTEEFCIPYQLQLLFARLMTSEQKAASTKDLTHSFHWDNQVFQQHDIQELMLVLFEALTKIFAKSKDGDPDFFEKMFRGECSSYIAGETFPLRKRLEKFTDLSLPINGKNSLEEGFKGYIEPEFLQGQYTCDIAKRKVDILKGLAFEKLPPIMFLQIGRFSFDFQRMARIKLQHEVRFPDVLDMSPFLPQNPANEFVPELIKLAAEKGVQIPEESFKSDPDFVESKYDLFGAVIHAGSAHGGHYYAHIKDIASGQWFAFNDASVTHITDERRALSFGGEKSSGTAYCLLYRRKDLPKEVKVLVPERVKKVIDEEDEKRRLEFEEWDKKQRQISVTCIYNDNSVELKEIDSQEVNVAGLIEMLREAHEIDPNVAPDCVRIRDWNSRFKFAEKPFEDLESPLRVAGLNRRQCQVMLETRQPDEEFPEFDPNDVVLRFYYVKPDDVKETADNAIKVSNGIDEDYPNMTWFTINKTILASELMAEAQKRFPEQNLKLYGLNRKLMTAVDVEQTIDGNGIEMGDVVFVESVPQDSEPKLLLAYEDAKLKIIIGFNDPRADGPVKYDFEVLFNKLEPIKKLKQYIANFFELELDEFRLKRSSSGTMLRDGEKSIDSHGINTLVYCELGTPVGLDEALVKLQLYDRTGEMINQENKTGGKRKRKKKLQKDFLNVAIKKTLIAKDLREIALRKLNRKYPGDKDGSENSYGIKHVRFRKLQGSALNGVIWDEVQLSTQSRPDVTGVITLAIEATPNETSFSRQDIVLHCRRYIGNEGPKGKLFSNFEIFLNRDSTIRDLKNAVIDHYSSRPDYNLEYDDLQLARGRKLIKPADCDRLKWLTMPDIDDNMLRDMEHLGVRNGDYVIFQDLKYEMSEEQKAAIAEKKRQKMEELRARRKNWKTTGQVAQTVGSFKKKSRAEVGLKIWTEDDYAEMKLKEKQMEEEEARKKAEETALMKSKYYQNLKRTWDQALYNYEQKVQEKSKPTADEAKNHNNILAAIKSKTNDGSTGGGPLSD